MVTVSTDVMDVAVGAMMNYSVRRKVSPTQEETQTMTAPAFDPEDWRPEDASHVGTDPLDLESLDERWTTFYTERMIAQAERRLKAEAEREEG